MFTDHMFFSAATEMFWVLVTLMSVAMNYRVRCFNKCMNMISLHLTPGSPAPSSSISFLTARNCSACSSNNFRSGTRVARTVRDLFPSGCSAPANGKEETSC